ncbi:Carbonic anhydrase [Poriferisphaera corsica]|uniref:Carbonic anhydrase n=1 Tax=Poriferisphaera corsica TaxID=2528020 RepID=A0A517YRH6_9BACT|nr:carbonic anhydrase [Poriferisphaera corsica]QDU32814.1 Carbonic anhydrase [Poriferisphaera corsica]
MAVIATVFGRMLCAGVILVGLSAIGSPIHAQETGLISDSQMAEMRNRFANKITADDAVRRLKGGNQQFVKQENSTIHLDLKQLKTISQADQSKYAFATILSCSDSRVPLELIFDQSFLDLFVIRVAGNVSGVSQLGSIEYGLAHVKTPVLLVLGHENCGAVEATIQAVDQGNLVLERNIPALIEQIKPAVERTKKEHPNAKDHELLDLAIAENVYQQIAQIYYLSPVTRKLSQAGLVRVVGAVYNLRNGEISWLSQNRINGILSDVLSDPDRVKDVYAIPEVQFGLSEAAPLNGYPMSHVYRRDHDRSIRESRAGPGPDSISAKGRFSITGLGAADSTDPAPLPYPKNLTKLDDSVLAIPTKTFPWQDVIIVVIPFAIVVLLVLTTLIVRRCYSK